MKTVRDASKYWCVNPLWLCQTCLRHDSWSFGTLEIPFGVIKVSSVLYVKDIRHSGLWKRVETSTYQSTLTKRMIPVCLKLDRNLFLQEALSKNTTFEKIPVRLSKIPVGLKVDRNFFLQEALSKTTTFEKFRSVHPFGLYKIKRD